MTGGLVDVGDYRLRIKCQGSGNPTVVMDTGLNMPMTTWESIPQEVSKFTRVCIYERTGIGESDVPPEQLRISKNVVTDIHKLLQNAGEKSPFILAGHSFGGIKYETLFKPFSLGASRETGLREIIKWYKQYLNMQ